MQHRESFGNFAKFGNNSRNLRNFWGRISRLMKMIFFENLKLASCARDVERFAAACRCSSTRSSFWTSQALFGWPGFSSLLHNKASPVAVHVWGLLRVFQGGRAAGGGEGGRPAGNQGCAREARRTAATRAPRPAEPLPPGAPTWTAGTWCEPPPAGEAAPRSPWNSARLSPANRERAPPDLAGAGGAAPCCCVLTRRAARRGLPGRRVPAVVGGV